MIKVFVLAVISLSGPTTEKTEIVREYSTQKECDDNIDKYSRFVRENENYIRCIPMYRKRTEEDK